MSLVGFKPQNHPGQVKARGAKDKVDDRGTPLEWFDPVRARFDFTVDVAASSMNAKCARFFTIDDDGLSRSWEGERVWCNPPYSGIRAWVEKAWEEFDSGSCDLIVMLLPANRTEQAWWQDLVEPYRDDGEGFTVEFIRRRLEFVQPGGERKHVPFGCCLLIWQRKAAP